MSIYLLASGSLIADPQRRQGAKGAFTTATILANGDEIVLVSIIAFGDVAPRLLEYVKGDAIAVAGRARVSSWTGRDGAEKHGISLLAEQIAAAKPRRKSAASVRRTPSTRRLYSPPQRPAPALGADLPEDTVADLFAEADRMSRGRSQRSKDLIRVAERRPP